MVKIAKLARDLDVDTILAKDDPHNQFYKEIRERGNLYLVANPELAESSPLTEKQRRAGGFDDSDTTWYKKLPVLTL